MPLLPRPHALHRASRDVRIDPPAADAALRWEPLNLARDGTHSSLIESIPGVVPVDGIGARAWNLEARLGPDVDWRGVSALVLRRADEALGCALFMRRSRPLKFQVGEVTLGAVQLTRHWHVGEPLLPAGLDPAHAARLAGAAVDFQLGRLGAGEALFFEGLPLGGALHAALAPDRATRRDRLVIQLGAAYEHQFIRFPPTHAEYLGQLGSRSRQSLQYSRRRLDREMDGDVRAECFCRPQDVDRFVRDASAISRRTYQWNLLGLGLRDDPQTRARLAHAAQRGWMHCFILYCRGRPVSFMLGELYGGCYYYDDVGYDPDYADWSVGSVLQMHVLEQLYARPDPPAFFDFSTGYGHHKGRFGNESRREVNLLVLPRTPRNTLVVAAWRANARGSRLAIRLLERVNAKDKLKRAIRRLSLRR